MNKQTVLITGANKSIGYETARIMARAGYHVFVGSRDKSNGEAAIARMKAEGLENVELVLIDVTSEQSVTDAQAFIAQRTPQLDVLVNNAGIAGGFPQPAIGIADETMKEVFDTNVFGPVRVIRIFMNLLKKAGVPRIVNVTSDLGSLTLHNDATWKHYTVKTGAYGPSKTALNAYTVALAYELRDTPFKVNAANPGYTATDFNNHTGPKDVKDAAKTIAQYAMLDASGPTGQFVSEEGVTPW